MAKKSQVSIDSITEALDEVDTAKLVSSATESVVVGVESLSKEEREAYEVGLALIKMSQEFDNIYEIKLGSAGGRTVIDCKFGNKQLVFGSSLIDAISKLSY